MKKIILALAAITLGSTMAVPSAMAGSATDALSMCLADSTTGKERKDLARWVFVGMSAHPDMQSLSRVTEANRDQLDRMMASMLMRLMTDNCRIQAKSAMDKDGPGSFQTAFGIIGKLAMQELMSDPEVSASFSRYAKYLDQEKMRAAFSNK